MIDFAALKERVALREAFEFLDLLWPAQGTRAHPVILCPFEGHDEKTPSCTLYPEDNKVWCYGCDRGGDVIDVVRLVKGVDFVEAVKQLADFAGLHEINGLEPKRDLSPRELLEIVSVQAHTDVVKWMKRHEITVDQADTIFPVYDEIMRQHRAQEMDDTAALRRLLAWRAQWKLRLT